MNTMHNPKAIHAPVGDIYSHGAEVPPNARLLWVSGEVGITPAGDVVKGFEAQARTAWENIAEVLARIPQMDCQFDDLLGRFCYKNQCNTIIATGQTRLTLRVTQESSLCGSISTAA